MRKGGLAIIIILVVALVVGFLVMQNMKGGSNSDGSQPSTQQDLEKMAQDAANLITENLQNSDIANQLTEELKNSELVDQISEQVNNELQERIDEVEASFEATPAP